MPLSSVNGPFLSCSPTQYLARSRDIGENDDERGMAQKAAGLKVCHRRNYLHRLEGH